MTGVHGLLERESELTLGRGLMQEAREARGRVVAVEGPPGIGKSALLTALCHQAAKDGLLVLRARGGEVERDFPFGVVRQLFEPHLRGLDDGLRARLLSGAAMLAAPVVIPNGPPAPGATERTPSHAIDHGLYWLTANLADHQPVVLAVDDAQWSDAVSLRFLLHLARRLDGVAVLLIVAVRTAEPDAHELLARLTGEPVAVVLAPAPLSQAGVGRLIARRLGSEPDADFVEACLRATGGTPFLVEALASAFLDAGLPPTGDSVPNVQQTGPHTVARATLARLERLSPDAAELARAVAVLGPAGRLDQAARLAGVDPAQAAGAADALAAMEILRPDRPLEFVHPIVRSAIYDALPAGKRAAAHARAAAILDEGGLDDDTVAVHLLQAEPLGESATVERLRRAAAGALGRGAPESAVVYLSRALGEGGLDRERRAHLLHELGRAERPLGLVNAVNRLREALAVMPDPVQRGRIAYDLADALFYFDRGDETTTVVDTAITEVERIDPELAVRLEALRMMQAFLDTRRAGVLRRLPELQALAGPDSPARRVMALLVGALHASLGAPADEVRRLVDIGLTDDLVLAEESPESWVLTPVYQSLALTDELDRGLRIAHIATDEALRRGSSYGFSYNLGYRAWLHARRGDLVEAEADMRAALAVIRDHGVRLAEVGAFFFVVDAIVERPDLDDEAGRLLALEPAPELDTTLYRSLFLEARGRVRLARGDVQGAIRDLQECAQTLHAQTNPNGWGWRPALALALGQSATTRALELASEELDRARPVGYPRAIGVAMRTLGLLEGGRRGLDHLEEAVEVLGRSPSRLEQARASIEFGGALRRANHRSAAREPLRHGLDLAARCGATRLAERARAELMATGARPRRDVLAGRDALTATERRIADMASEGMSNPEIAQALFVTRKTVENHLLRIYAKLGINSRTRLAEALASSATDR